MKGMAMTVLGSVPTDRLGITLMHEHVLFDFRAYNEEPLEASLRALAHEAVQISNLGRLNQDPFLSVDNCFQLDSRVATEELSHFKRLGGATIVDLTSMYNGRDPLALQEISRETGLNVVMGCGYYIWRSHPPNIDHLTQDDITREIVREVIDGVGDTGVRPGIIGEIGTSSPIRRNEEKSLRAAVAAQAETGAALTIHLIGWARDGLRILDVVRQEGGAVERTILDHMNPSHDDFQYQSAIAEQGAYVEYDMLGMDYLYPQRSGEWPDLQCPSDHECIRGIKRLIDAGYVEKVLLSQDVFLKTMLTRYGGFGYAHILRTVVRALRKSGVDDEQIHTMLVENPRRLLAFDR
jgi:phosphotriesterase-related protein